MAVYELVNWQMGEKDHIEFVTVGHYDASVPAGQEFSMTKDILWADGGTEVCQCVTQVEVTQVEVTQVEVTQVDVTQVEVTQVEVTQVEVT